VNRKVKITLFIAGILLLGLFRESLFLNVNAILYNKYYGEPGAHRISGLYAGLEALSYKTLYISKWFITLAFVAAFWLVQRGFLHILLHEKKALLWLSMLYLSLLLLAAISFGAGWLTGNTEQGYRFSRIFMGLLQSPVPCMVLVPLTYFYKQNQNSL
jgi:hypothetical protein